MIEILNWACFSSPAAKTTKKIDRRSHWSQELGHTPVVLPTQDAEAEGSKIQGQSELHSKTLSQNSIVGLEVRLVKSLH